MWAWEWGKETEREPTTPAALLLYQPRPQKERGLQMEKYNYLEAIKADVRDYIEEEINLDDFDLISVNPSILVLQRLRTCHSEHLFKHIAVNFIVSLYTKKFRLSIAGRKLYSFYETILLTIKTI